MKPDYLTQTQYDVLLRTLSRFTDRIDRIDVYGSRARGTHRPGSDIDLIVAGDLDLMGILSIGVALEESDLSIFADVERYSDKLSPTFAKEVARDARTLFTREDLLAARSLVQEPFKENAWRR